MNLFDVIDDKVRYRPKTIQAIRDLKAGETLTIGGWLRDLDDVVISPVGESMNWIAFTTGYIVGDKIESKVRDVLNKVFFPAIQESPGKITLLVPAELVGRVREVWPVKECRYCGFTGQGFHELHLSNVVLVLDMPEPKPEPTDSQLRIFLSLGPLCSKLLIKVGDVESEMI